jgi:hypothetical protein
LAGVMLVFLLLIFLDFFSFPLVSLLLFWLQALTNVTAAISSTIIFFINSPFTNDVPGIYFFVGILNLLKIKEINNKIILNKSFTAAPDLL